jgi:hypothetical protein
MCAAVKGGHSTDGVDQSKETIIEGTVRRGGEGTNAYVRLLDSSGEFTAELPTADDGTFRFFAGPGRWIVRTLAPKADPVDRVVLASHGQVATLEVVVP